MSGRVETGSATLRSFLPPRPEWLSAVLCLQHDGNAHVLLSRVGRLLQDVYLLVICTVSAHYIYARASPAAGLGRAPTAHTLLATPAAAPPRLQLAEAPLSTQLRVHLKRTRIEQYEGIGPRHLCGKLVPHVGW